MNQRNTIRFFPRLAVFSAMLLAAALGLPAPASAQNADGKSKMMELWTPGDSGQRMRIRGRVTSIDGTPLANVAVGIRHADSRGIDYSYHQGVVTTNDEGVYQFGSVVPGNSHRLSHVHVTVSHDGYRYLNTEFHFKDDPKAAEDDPEAIFLEAGTVAGETMMFGRYDITLVPN